MRIDAELYDKIREVMPIPCVDLLVVDWEGKILLLHRKNEPASGKWWFPGGRVLIGEKRIDAARRKLIEECGLLSHFFENIGTFEIMFNSLSGSLIHSITTIFKVIIESEQSICIDSQSFSASWLSPREWMDEKLDKFVADIIASIEL